MTAAARPGRRARLSRRGMNLGVAFVLGGAILRFGAIPLGLGANLTDPPAGPSSTSPSPDSPPDPGATAPLESPGALPGAAETWFADDFTTEAAWPVGELGLVVAAIVDERYVLDAEATDLPVVILAAAGDSAPGAVGGSVLVQAGVVLEAGDAATSAGVVLEDHDGMRLLVLVAADGRIGLYRDSLESFDLLASASIAEPAGSVSVGVRLDGDAIVVLADGVAVTTAQIRFVPTAVGLGVWSPTSPAKVAVDNYRVWLSTPI